MFVFVCIDCVWPAQSMAVGISGKKKSKDEKLKKKHTKKKKSSSSRIFRFFWRKSKKSSKHGRSEKKLKLSKSKKGGMKYGTKVEKEKAALRYGRKTEAKTGEAFDKEQGQKSDKVTFSSPAKISTKRPSTEDAESSSKKAEVPTSLLTKDSTKLLASRLRSDFKAAGEAGKIPDHSFTSAKTTDIQKPNLQVSSEAANKPYWLTGEAKPKSLAKLEESKVEPIQELLLSQYVKEGNEYSKWTYVTHFPAGMKPEYIYLPRIRSLAVSETESASRRSSRSSGDKNDEESGLEIKPPPGTSPPHNVPQKVRQQLAECRLALTNARANIENLKMLAGQSLLEDLKSFDKEIAEILKSVSSMISAVEKVAKPSSIEIIEI